MGLRSECKAIAGWGFLTLLALGDADRLVTEGRHKDAYQANARAIGWLYTCFKDNVINREELDKLTTPIINANAAYEKGKIEDLRVPFDAVEDITDLFLQKTCDCQCRGV